MAKAKTAKKAPPKKAGTAKVSKKTAAKKVVAKKTQPAKKAITKKQPPKKVSKPKTTAENKPTPYPWTAYRKKQAKAALIKQYNGKESIKVNTLLVTYHPDGSATAPGKDFQLHTSNF